MDGSSPAAPSKSIGLKFKAKLVRPKRIPGSMGHRAGAGFRFQFSVASVLSAQILRHQVWRTSVGMSRKPELGCGHYEPVRGSGESDSCHAAGFQIQLREFCGHVERTTVQRAPGCSRTTGSISPWGPRSVADSPKFSGAFFHAQRSEV